MYDNPIPFPNHEWTGNRAYATTFDVAHETKRWATRA
ncbi:hypothetical protein LMG24235_00392 [Paraburkholderia sabiae]|nr:hypothetical protein LMG24235_00392 [Paraburkholderia sabiae]